MGKICYFSFVRIMFFVIFSVLATVQKLWFRVVVCGQLRARGGRGVKNWQNFVDVFYGWSHIQYT